MLKRIDGQEFTVLVTGPPVRRAYFFYTPLCGTCKAAEKMCLVASEAIARDVYACNINEMPDAAARWRVESVPCLVLAQGQEQIHKLYAFESVTKVHGLLKQWLLVPRGGSPA